MSIELTSEQKEKIAFEFLENQYQKIKNDYGYILEVGVCAYPPANYIVNWSYIYDVEIKMFEKLMKSFERVLADNSIGSRYGNQDLMKVCEKMERKYNNV